jgi:F0F1-type ATP synthase epsilon subunit
MANQSSIKVKIRDSLNVLYEGDVERISSFNEMGPFDVYPMHANFISIIRQKLALYQKKMIVKELNIEQAVMKVKKDAVHIFLGIDALIIEDEQNAAKTPTAKKVA